MTSKPKKPKPKKGRYTRGKLSPEARVDADAFFEHKRRNPGVTPYDKLTPLQKRMQSGDA